METIARRIRKGDTVTFTDRLSDEDITLGPVTSVREGVHRGVPVSLTISVGNGPERQWFVLYPTTRVRIH